MNSFWRGVRHGLFASLCLWAALAAILVGACPRKAHASSLTYATVVLAFAPGAETDDTLATAGGALGPPDGCPVGITPICRAASVSLGAFGVLDLGFGVMFVGPIYVWESWLWPEAASVDVRALDGVWCHAGVTLPVVRPFSTVLTDPCGPGPWDAVRLTDLIGYFPGDTGVRGADIDAVAVQAVPEPSTLLLTGVCLTALVVVAYLNRSEDE